MTDDDPEDESLPLRELNRLAGGACMDCALPYTARHAVFSIALGFKNAPRCLPCTARRLGRLEDELTTQLVEYVHRRECYLKAWREAERLDEEPPTIRERKSPESSTSPGSLYPGSPTDGVPESAQFWDAGDMGCGELVMELRIRLNKLPPASVIQVTAIDPAAPEDIPAWCRLCGHTLVAMGHPNYTIRKRGD